GGQRVVGDLDEVAGVLRDVAALRHHDGDAFADVADLFGRQAAPGVAGGIGTEVGHRVAQLGRLGARDDRHHPGQLSGRGDVDSHDPGVGVGTADDGGVEHLGEDEVVDVPPAAPQEPGVLDPGDGLADPLEVGRVL